MFYSVNFTRLRLFLRDLASFLSMVFCIIALCAAMAAFRW